MPSNHAAEQPSEPTPLPELHIARDAIGGRGVVGFLPYAGAFILVAVLGTALWKSGVVQANIFATVPFILAVQIVAFAWGPGPAIVAALAGAGTFGYYWIGIGPPGGLEAPSPQDWLLFAALSAIGLGLTDRMRFVRRQARMVAASERLQRALLDSISHDLRTPLTTIVGSLNTLLVEDGAVGRIDAASRRELLSIAYDRAKVLDRLVAEVLEMIKLESGVPGVQAEPDSLGTVVTLAMRSLGEPIDVRCRINIPPDTPPVRVNQVLFAHALRNIVENAARFSPAGSPVEIDAARTPRRVLLSVADRGPGIPEADLERVFEKFYRRPGRRSGGGVGLGLTIAKGIVEAHGGRIWAERREGGGTVVRIALPVT